MEDSKKWRKLDNSGKLFPILSTKRFSTVFRISCVLKDQVKKEFLFQAVKQALKKCPSFAVRLRRGFFWNYFEQNDSQPVVEEEWGYPCGQIEKEQNHGYLFKVSYFKKKINLDVFHSLTDGNTGIEFLKVILNEYFCLVYSNLPKLDTQMSKLDNIEDSYITYYTKEKHGRSGTKLAYTLKGKNFPLYRTGVTHFTISLKELRKTCKEKEATVTEYLTALLIHSIYQGNQIPHQKQRDKKPINICIPVNLKKYFDSDTINNFFSYISVSFDKKKKDILQFNSILEWVKEEFDRKLTEEQVTKTMSSNVLLGNHIMIKTLPLFLKRTIVQIAYLAIRRYTTITLSNMGAITMPKEYEDLIESFWILIAPESVERTKCAVCSYQGNLNFTFTSTIAEDYLQKSFEKELQEQKIAVKKQTNGMYGKEEKQMLYPILQDITKSRILIPVLLFSTTMICLVCFLLNYLFTPQFAWSILVVVGMIYVWVVSLYSIKKNKNIAAHVMFQTFAVTIILLILDGLLGFSRWSIIFAIPITTAAANLTVFVLLLITKQKYVKYMIYQFILFFFTSLQLLFLIKGDITNLVFILISVAISMMSLLSTILLLGKEVKEELEKRFNL